MRNKKAFFLFSFILSILIVLSGCTVSCGDKYGDMKIEIKGDSEITLYTEPENAEQLKSTTVSVVVSGVSEETSKYITYVVENQDCVDVVVGEPDEYGVSEITITARQGGSTKINLVTVEGAKTLTLSVNVIEKLKSIALYPNFDLTVYTNSTNTLEPVSILSFNPSTTSQKDIKFDLVETYSNIEIIKTNGVTSLVVGDCATQIIKVKATAVENDQPIENIPTVEFEVKVIEKLSVETVVIQNITLDEVVTFVNNAYETIELTSNSPITSENRTNSLQITVEPKNPTECKFLIEDFSSMDISIAELSKTSDTDTFVYDITGVSFGDTALRFVITIEGFTGYEYEVLIPVHIIEMPSSITVNGNTEDFSGTLFTVYDTWGMKFEVTVGSSNAYDFRYEIRCDSDVVTLYDSIGGIISLMDIEGDTLKRTNPRLAQTTDVIYAVAKVDAADKNISSAISFVACATLEKNDTVVDTNFNFTVSQGVKSISLEEFENNIIYVEKDGTATLNYTLEPKTEVDGEETIVYDDSYISYAIKTNGGEEFISVNKSTTQSGQFVITGLKNTDKVSLCVTSANGVSSKPVNVSVYTPGTFVAVSLPSASTNNNILSTNYSSIAYGDGGVYNIDSLAQPFADISYENGIVATLEDGESVETPVFGAIIATNTTSKFTLTSDPSNKDQTIIGTSYKFVVPEISGNNVVSFRDFDSSVDNVKGTITAGGYLQTTDDGTLYVLVEVKFLTGGEENGTVESKSYYRLIAINSYPKITSVSLKTVNEDVVYNKQGLGNIDVWSSDLKTFNFTRLTIGPESALNKEILRSENTSIEWNLYGVPNGVKIKYYTASSFKEFNNESAISINTLSGINVIFDDNEGAYEFSDSEDFIYTRAYVMFNFDDQYFGNNSSMVFTMSVQLTQFNTTFQKSINITVKRPVKASAVDLSYTSSNVSTNENQILGKISKYSYELYIDSRNGLNLLEDVKNLTVKNKNLTNSWSINATLHPSNITNGKINYIVCDSLGNEVIENNIIKVLEDGTVIPLASGVTYVKLVPMSGELNNTYLIKVRVADGESWDSAYKIYNQADLLSIQGDSATRYETMKKYYELANDIYLNSTFTPIGVYADEVVAFSGGLRGSNAYTDEVYKIYNFDIKSKEVDLSGTKTTYAGLFGKVDGEIIELGLVVKACDLTLTNSGDAYVGALAGMVGETGIIRGVVVEFEQSEIYTTQSMYFGGVVGYNGGQILDNEKTVVYDSGYSAVILTRTQVSGPINIETSTNINVGGIVGVNKGEIVSDFNYFAETINYNNANENTDNEINVISTSFSGAGNIGGISGTNMGSISKIASVAKIDANVENAGGIVGLNYGELTDCYFVGQIKNAKNVGGICGKIDVLQSATACTEVKLTRCICEILDTTISKTTLVTESRIQGQQNVGGLVGYADFTVAGEEYSYTTGYNLIDTCYVRSYLPLNTYSDLYLQNATGNVGGLIGYGKNTHIINSYAIVNLSIDRMVEGLNVGGLVGKYENVSFKAKKLNIGSNIFTNNILIEDCFVSGNINVKATEENVSMNVGQLVGLFNVGASNTMLGLTHLTNRIYTNVNSIVDYNELVTFGLIGSTQNITSGNLSSIFNESYYLYPLSVGTPHNIGKAVSLFELQDIDNTFAVWDNRGTKWRVLSGSNNNMMIIYTYVGEELLPFYTITPTDIDLNIKGYTPEDEDQLFTRVDSLSTSTNVGAGDDTSKSAVLYIYEDDEHKNEYLIDDVVKISTVPVRLNNSRYIVVSDNENVVKVVGDKFYPVGEGTCIITICSAYNKESVYDCIQLAVVYHNFDMIFMNKDMVEYTEDETVLISKSGTEQLIVYIDSNSSIAGVVLEGDIHTDNENALTVNGKVLGSNLVFNTSTNSVYNNILSISENKYYEETTAITLNTIPYFNISLYANPMSPTVETLSSTTIYNNADQKLLNILIYVGATEVLFNTNNVSSNIGSEISVTVTLKTDYEEDSILMFHENELVLSDDTQDIEVKKEEFTISYHASSKNVAKYYDNFEEREVFAGYITYEFKINASDKYLNILDNDMEILYEAISSSIVFAGKSSYISDTISENINDYPVKNEFNFKITPASVSSISIQNFAAGRTVSGKYDPSEDPSYSIVPGEVGLIDILITPMYAGVTRITLENATTNYTKVSLLQVMQEAETGLYIQSNHLITNTENGIELVCKSNVLSDGTTVFDGHIYVRTLIASEIPLNIELTLVVTAYFEEDGKETSKVESITLITTQTSGVFVDFDGNNYAYVVKGSSVTPRTKVIGFTNPVIFKLSDIEPTYKNFVHYFDPNFTNMIPEGTISDEEIEILFNDQIRVNPETGETYVGVLIRKGIMLTVEASVTEYVNNGGKVGSDSVNIYVLDYIIKGIKVQNTVNNTLTAVCNIPKTLKVDFDIERCDYYDYKYNHLSEVLTNSVYVNVVRAVELFFGIGTTSSIDIELNNLLREINTYEHGIWMYTSDPVGSSVRNYKSIVVGESYDKLFEVQTGSYENNSSLTCFALRVKEITTLSFKANVRLTFAFDTKTNTVSYKFNPLNDPSIVGDLIEFNFNFNVTSIDSSSQDNPLPIYDYDKFIEYVFNTEDLHYILLTDITLNNWTAKDTNIASLDGNGYTIKINSFAEGTDDKTYFGLFKTISENTILTNVNVLYNGNKIDIKTTNEVGETNVGLFAYENLGTLFNCSVTTDGETNIEVTTNATTIKNALFVVNNGITGSISNSRVGNIDGTGENGNTLHFKSYNDIAGFVTTNQGHIASSFAKNISLTSKELKAVDIDETGVAGFVIDNMSSGKIYFSYVEGIRGDDTESSQIQLSKQGYKKYNTGIFSPGRISGFVFRNTGYIQDTYANIPLISPTSSTGFVYQNNKGANISNAFSVCLQPTTLDGNQEEYPNTSRSQFTGLGDLNEVLNEGNISYAYYYNAEYDSNIFTGLGEPALALPADSFKDSLDEFGNFVGGENMIWVESPLHPQLVSANRVIKRQRYLVNNLTGDESDEVLEEYIYYYEDIVDGEYDAYGSYTNPIIIASGSQFVQMSDPERLTPYTNTSTNTTTLTSLNKNDYIVIKDIDVSTVIDTGLENLQSITYAGMFEGNGYTFKNVSILSDKSSKLRGVSFGMFEQIGALLLFENDILLTVDTTNYHAQMKNLTIEINAISGTHATAVGTLAGVIVNADILNINLVSNAGNEKLVTVQGERYVGSVAGYIAGDSSIINITSNISVSADFRNTGSDVSQIRPYIMGNDSISNSIYAYKFEIDTDNYTGGYAGGIAGLIDCFTLKITKNADTTFASISRYDFDKTGYNYVSVNFPPQVSTVTVHDEVHIIGDVVGGIVGINCQGTSIYNARFMLELGETQKISGEIIAGGLVGQNYGKIDQSALTHDPETQLAIDDGTTEKDEVSKELFYESSKKPTYVGGLVGYNEGSGNNSGVVTNCYSRANVISYNAEYVGGMVGYMANGYLQYCYVSGNVISSQERIDPTTGSAVGKNGIAAGAVGYLASFVSKNAIKYFTEYTGLSYYSMWALVCANDWEDNVNLSTTSALIGYASSSIKVEDGIINGDMDIFVNNMNEKLYDILYSYSVGDAYNIVNVTELGGSVSKFRLIQSYSYETFKAYANEGANPDENILYQTWDRNIWDVTQPYFPLLLLNTNGDQTYITNEDELRSIGTDGFYIIQNDIYLTKDWIPVEGFEGTLTSKKKKDGTYCTIYNININGECYNTVGEDEETIENIGNIGFFSSIKDKAYIYNVNFVFGGNIILPENYETTDDGTPIHVQRNQWENYQGLVGYTENSGLVGEITYEKAFINGITNHLDYAQIIKNNVKDLQDGLFVASYGTGALAGVATNATFSNITVSFGEYTYYGRDGRTGTTKRASINANTPYIGGFIGYASNTKLTNCQVTENPIATYVKNNLNKEILIDGAVTINVYNNEYINALSTETIKGIVKDFNLERDAKIILEFYQQPQCVGGFIGKLDANSNYIKFNGRMVDAHINVLEKYVNGSKHNLPNLTLNIGGLIGHSNVASLDSVNVNGTIVSAVNTTGVDVSKVNSIENTANKTELNIGGIIGVSDKSLFNYCVYQGTIKIVSSSQSDNPPTCKANSVVNIGGVIGKIRGDVSINYGISTGSTFSEVSGYKDYKDPIVISTKDHITNLNIGGVIGNAMTVSPKIKKSMINGNITLDCTVDNLYVGGILGSMISSNLLTNKATIQNCYTVGNIVVQAKVKTQILVGGVVGLAHKISASQVASTMQISKLGSTLDKNAIVYAGNFAGMLGYSGSTNAYVNDCFTAGIIRIDKGDLNGAIGGFVGVMFGTVKNSYSATTILSITDNNPVTVNCSESEKKYASESGIIGPMFGFSSTILQTSNTTTAFYVFDYTGCVMRSVEADSARYGVQVSVTDLTKECIYGTTDSIMSVFAGSTTGSWKTFTYGEYFTGALYAFSMPVLSFLEADTTLNSYCKFCETSNERINILSPSKTAVSMNTQAQAYQLYYGSKLYPYLLKQKDGYTLNDFRKQVTVNKVDVNNSYFALASDFNLDVSEVAFNKINFHLLGYGNAIRLSSGKLFANELESERIISSVNFISNFGIIGTNNGIIYNTVISGVQNYENVTGYASSFIVTNNGMVINSGINSKVTFNKLDKNAKFGLFIAVNGSKGIVNSCFSTAIIYYKDDALKGGEVSGFIHTVNTKAHLLNILSATTMNAVNNDKLSYDTKMNAFVTVFDDTEAVIERVFVDKLAIGYKNAYDVNVTKGNKVVVERKINFVNTSYLVDSEDEGDTASGEDDLKVLYGARLLEDDVINLDYALSGRNYNYDYYMSYNYGYPFPALVAYFEGRSLKESLFTGNGTESNPYQIQHAGKLDWFRTMLAEKTTKYFDITCDIYMNVYETFEPLLNNSNNKFNKVVEEDTYTKDTFDYYKNLCYPSSASKNPFVLNAKVVDTQSIIYYLTQNLTTDAGLFESLKANQQVKNLAITYANIKTTSPRVGVLTAVAKDNAVMNNVGVFNSLITIPTDMSGSANIGGLVGYAENMDSITKCSAEVKINMPASKNAINVGGLIGQTKNVKAINYCYSGSNINILDGENVKQISKTNIGGLVGFNINEINGGTTFDNCVTLTSVNYAGLTGYKYNLTNYSTEEKLSNAELNSKDKITSFANIGNILGASYTNVDTMEVDRVNIKNCYYSEDITMIANTYAIGNNYKKDYTGLLGDSYDGCKDKVNGLAYASVGARKGSKIKPIEIDGSTTTLTEFGEETDFALFGLITTDHVVPSEGVTLNGKFLYGGGRTVYVDGIMISKAENTILSQINVSGTASGKTTNSTGLLANYVVNTMVNQCTSYGRVESNAANVGGLIGSGSGSLILNSSSQATIESSGRNALVGGLAGKIDRGGYWFSKAVAVNIVATGSKAKVGGITGHVPQENAFMINCEINSGNVASSEDSGITGGLAGHLDGLMVRGKIGSASQLITLSGYYVGGVVGTVRVDAKNIFLNGFTVNINVTNSYNAGGVSSYLIGSGYVIKNTTVNGTLTGKKAVGGIAGYIESKVTIGVDENNKNVINANINCDGNNIGGVVGKATSSTIQYNQVNGKVKGTDNVGGVVGTSISATITNNKVTSEVEGSKNVGGILGASEQPDDVDNISGTTNVKLNNCSGRVYGHNENIGGIVGLSTQLGTTVESNIHTGNVEGKDNVGGIVGASSLPENKNSGTVLNAVTNEKKSGSVNARNGVAGGIIGYFASGTTDGNILGGSAAINITGVTAGGIIGKIAISIDKYSTDENATVQNDVMNRKDHNVQGTKFAGGLIGYSDLQTEISDVSVYVNLVNGQIAGGLVGYAENLDISSWTSIRFTNVTATNYAGGLVGQAESISICKQNISSGFGTIAGKDAGGYIGYATDVDIIGKKDAYLSISNFTVRAQMTGGSIGSAIGVAKNCQLSYINSNVTVNGSSENLGGFVGHAQSTSIEYIIVNKSLSGTATNVGGIVGRISGEGNNKVVNCTYKGSNIAHTASNAGGIVGKASGANISNNSITASITVTALNGGNAGGIVGNADACTVSSKEEIDVNVTSVTADGGNAGGIAGYVNNTSISSFTISKLTTVKADNVGSVVGSVLSSGSRDVNVNNITILKSITLTGSNVGGVAGYANGRGAEVKINDISYSLSTLTGSENVGGVVGYANYCNISNCKISTGFKLTATSAAGGVVGNADNTTIGAGNTMGKVTVVKAKYGGGILGYGTNMSDISSPKTLSVDITAENAGGIAGSFTGSDNTISGFTLSGSVKGSSSGNGNTGGVAGVASSTTISSITMSSLSVTATGGKTYGSIVGHGTSLTVSSVTVKSHLSVTGVTNAGAAVGKLDGGSVSISINDTDFSFLVTGSGGNYGAFIGYNTGSLTVTTSQTYLRLTVTVTNSSSNVGGFVGYNTGNITCPSKVIGANVTATNGNVAGIAGYNSGSIDGQYDFYYQVKGSTTAGVFASGNGTYTAKRIFVHKYGGVANTALIYAQARKTTDIYVNGYKVTPSTFKYGTTWGASTYLVYPGENFKFSNKIEDIFLLNSTCSDYKTATRSTLEQDIRTTPAYLREEGLIVYMQCEVSAGASKTYYYDNWRYSMNKDSGESMSDALSDFRGAYFSGETLYDINGNEVKSNETLFGDFASYHVKWNAYKNFKDSPIAKYTSVTVNDIRDAINECYSKSGYISKITNDYSNTETGWGSLRIAIKNAMESRFDDGSFGITDVNLMKRWVLFWRLTHYRYRPTNLFKSNNQFITELDRAGDWTYNGVDQAAHDSFYDARDYFTGKYKGKGSSTIEESGSSDSILVAGGAWAFYSDGDDTCNSDRTTLEQYFKNNPINSTNDELVTKTIATVETKMDGEIDESWTTTQLNYTLTCKFDIVCEYSYAIGVSPASGAPGNFSYSGGSGEYPTLRQGGGQEWSNDKLGSSRTIAQIGCLMTSVTCLIRSTGKVDEKFTPGVVNHWMTNHGGYAANENGDKCLFIWGALNNAKMTGTYKGYSYNYDLTGWKHVGSCGYSASKVRELLNKGYKCVIQVKSVGEHWCAVTGSDGSKVSVMDPAYGDILEDVTTRKGYSSPTTIHYFSYM